MKTRLAIVFGSRACEHDVSIISGLQALYAADAQKYDAFPVYISREGEWFVGDALRKMEFYKKPDWGVVRRVSRSWTRKSTKGCSKKGSRMCWRTWLCQCCTA